MDSPAPPPAPRLTTHAVRLHAVHGGLSLQLLLHHLLLRLLRLRLRRRRLIFLWRQLPVLGRRVVACAVPAAVWRDSDTARARSA